MLWIITQKSLINGIIFQMTYVTVLQLHPELSGDSLMDAV